MRWSVIATGYRGTRFASHRAQIHSRGLLLVEELAMTRKPKLPNIHPGEVLLEEFLKPLGISQNHLGRDLRVPPRRINEIVLDKRSVPPDTALRLARYFGTSERFWLGLQMDFDLEAARSELAAVIEREVKPIAPVA